MSWCSLDGFNLRHSIRVASGCDEVVEILLDPTHMSVVSIILRFDKKYMKLRLSYFSLAHGGYNNKDINNSIQQQVMEFHLLGTHEFITDSKPIQR